MLDYHAHVAVVRELRATIGSAFAGDPTLAAAVEDLCIAVDDDPDAALLGACIDHVVAQAASDGTEVALLESAADLWSRGRALYDELALSRQELEGALGAPTAPRRGFAAAAGHRRGLDGLRTGALQIAHEAKMLKQAVAPLPPPIRSSSAAVRRALHRLELARRVPRAAHRRAGEAGGRTCR